MLLHLVRHAECEKNLIGIPGGAGAPLTARGVAQAKCIASKLGELIGGQPLLVACPAIQTVATAEIIGGHLGLSPSQDQLLASIHLGELTGVRIDEARERYPESSQSMDLWRAGALEIADLTIRGMEEPWEFYRRGAQFLLRYSTKDEIIVCCTTSIMILLSYLALGITPHSGDGYKVLSFENVEHRKFSISEETLASAAALLRA